MRADYLPAFVLFVLLASGMAFGAFMESCPYCYKTTVVAQPVKPADYDGTDLHIYVFVYQTQYANSFPDVQSIRDIFTKCALNGNCDGSSGGANPGDLADPTIKSGFFSLVDAKVTVYDKGKDSPQPQCNAILTSNPVQSSTPNPVVGQTVPQGDIQSSNYYALCSISRTYYQGSCKTYVIKYDGDGPIPAASTQAVLCDTQKQDFMAGLFNMDMSRLLTPVICFSLLGLFGTLLATLYFAGKNPMGLLDLTTPRLPGPKSFAAGGRTISQWGYARMNANIDARMAYLNNNIFKIGMSELGAGRLSARPGFGKAGTASKVAAGLLSKSGASMNDVHAALNAKADTSAGQKTLAGLLSKVDKKNPTRQKYAHLYDAVEDYMHMASLKRSIGGATGLNEDTATTTIHKKMMNLIRFATGGTPMVGSFFGTSMVTLTRGAKATRNLFFKAVPSEIVRTAVDIGTLGKAEEKSREWAGKGGAAGFASKLITMGSPSKLHIGYYYDVQAKKAQAYDDLIKAAYYDLYSGIIAKIYKTAGADLEHVAYTYDYSRDGMLKTMKDLAKRIETLERSAQLSQIKGIEEELKRMLVSEMSYSEKAERLMSYADRLGALESEYRASVRAFSRQLGGIHDQIHAWEASNNPADLESAFLRRQTAYDRLVEFIQSETRHQPYQFSGSTFTTALGRSDLGAGFFGFYAGRTLLENLISEHFTPGSGLMDNLKVSWLHFVNNLYGVGNAALSSEVNSVLGGLMTDAGRAEMRRIGTKSTFDMLSSQASIYYDYRVKDAYGSRGALMKVKAQRKGMMSGGGMYLAGLEANEIGPKAEWWKTNMKFSWHTDAFDASKGLNGQSDPRTVFSTTKGFFERGAREFSLSSVANELANALGKEPDMGKPADREMVYNTYMKHFLKIQMFDVLGGLDPNAYSHMNETHKFLNGLTGLYMNHVLGKLTDEDKEKMDKLGTTAEVEEFLQKKVRDLMRTPISYEDLASSKTAWLGMHEGGMVPYAEYSVEVRKLMGIIKGKTNSSDFENAHLSSMVSPVPLGDFDRVINGYVSYYDKKTGRWQRFDPSQEVRFDDDSLNRELDGLMRLSRGRGVSGEAVDNEAGFKLSDADKQKWRDFMDKLKTLHEAGKLSSSSFANTVSLYSDAVKEPHTYWSDAKVSIKAKEVVGPTIGTSWYSPTRIMEKFGMMDAASAVGGVFRYGTRSFERMMSLAAMDVVAGSYAVTPVSELLREKGMGMAHNIKGGGYSGASDEMKKSLEGYSRLLFQYQCIWDSTIDRNPWRSSTSTMDQHMFATMYHLGPPFPFPLATHAPGFNASQWWAFRALTAPSDIALSLFKPIALAGRSLQMAMRGYPGKYDMMEGDPLRPFYSPPPAPLTGVRSFLNPFSSVVSASEFVSRIPSYPFRLASGLASMVPVVGPALSYLPKKVSGWWEGGPEKGVQEFISPMDKYVSGGNNMMKRGLAGREFQTGLPASPETANWIRKNIYQSGREGNANPGASYYDYYYNLHLDQPMASYLKYGYGWGVPDKTKEGFFFGDSKRGRDNQETWYSSQVGKDADRLTVKRESTSFQLGLRREQEFYGYSIFQNPIMAFTNPLFFAWRNPLFPSISGSSLWDMGKSARMSGGSTLSNMASRGGRFVKDAWADARRATVDYHRDMVICPICGAWKPRFGQCTRSHRR
ncbi:MAG: hypothetical protein ACP5NX_04240 [Candidatus Bilamarchaeaceae archaeon]